MENVISITVLPLIVGVLTSRTKCLDSWLKILCYNKYILIAADNFCFDQLECCKKLGKLELMLRKYEESESQMYHR